MTAKFSEGDKVVSTRNGTSIVAEVKRVLLRRRDTPQQYFAYHITWRSSEGERMIEVTESQIQLHQQIIFGD